MKQFAGQIWIYALMIALVACSDDQSGKQFEISGTIKNSVAKKVYLEEVPPGSNQGTIVDSCLLGPGGSYALKTEIREALVYNLRLDQGMYPLALPVINDVPKVTLNVVLQEENNQYVKEYEVKGSPVSQQAKDFMSKFYSDLQDMRPLIIQIDSLQRKEAPDSLLTPLYEKWEESATALRNYSMNSLENANNPALFAFELGYYLSNARSDYGLEQIDIEEASGLVNEIVDRFPDHRGLKAVKQSLDYELARMKKMEEAVKPQWIGKPAPDFTLPDVNGKQVQLSSFRGQYVLVDFWASWCGPCRHENPNVVKAYNKFKDRNFTVLGVSLDRPGEKDEWLQAIREDNLTWTHVSDLRFWDSRIVPLYKINGIPYNVLINKEGVVIGENLKGRRLISKLEEVLN